MLYSTLLTYLNRLSPSRGKRCPRRAGPTRRSRPATRPTLEVLEDRLALSNAGYTFPPIDDPNAVNGRTYPVGINDRGQIVGGYVDANGVGHAFLLSGGQYTTLADAPNAYPNTTFAYGINNRGQIFGNYQDLNGNFHNFLLSGGQYTTLADPPNSIYT